MFKRTHDLEVATPRKTESRKRDVRLPGKRRCFAIGLTALVVLSSLLPRDQATASRLLGALGAITAATSHLTAATSHVTSTARASKPAANTETGAYMLYHGGLTQTSPRLYIVYWGNWTDGDPYAAMNRLYYFLKGVGGSPWNATVTGYGTNCTVGTFVCPTTATMITNPANQLMNWWKDTTSVPSVPTQAQLAAEANRAAFHFSDWSPNAQFVIATPTGHGDAGFRRAIAGQVGWCAWHSWTTSNGHPISYTNLPYIPDAGQTCGMNLVNAGAAGYLDGVTIVEGHEYAESETNPFRNAWYSGTSTTEDEIGDKCNGVENRNLDMNLQFSTGTFAIQALWSNYDKYYYQAGCAFSS